MALLAAFVAWQRRAPAPMLELGLFRSRRFVSGSLVYGVAYLALAGVLFFMTLYFQNVRGWSALETGLSLIPLNLPFLAVTPFAGRIVHALGSARTAGSGVLLVALGTATLAALSVDAAYAQAVVGYVLVGFGFGLVVPSVSSAAMSAVPPAHTGVGSGVLNAARQLGAALGLAVLGSIGHATATAAWNDHVAALAPALRGEAAALGQQVAGAEDRMRRAGARERGGATGVRGVRDGASDRPRRRGDRDAARGADRLPRPAESRALVSGWRAPFRRSGGSARAGPPGSARHPLPRARPSRYRR